MSTIDLAKNITGSSDQALAIILLVFSDSSLVQPQLTAGKSVFVGLSLFQAKYFLFLLRNQRGYN